MIRAHRVGTRPWPSTRPDDTPTPLLGPHLPLAACKGTAPLWDATRPGETETTRQLRLTEAKATCLSCPEMTACLRARLTDDSLGAGVFGAQLFGPPIGRRCRCGAHIPDTADPKKVHCGRPCREKALVERRPKTPPRHVVCFCGTRFTTRRTRQRYCRETCRREGEKQRRRGQQRQVAA